MSCLTSLVHTILTNLSFSAVTFFTRKCPFSNNFFQLQLGLQDINTVFSTCISWLSDKWTIVFIVQWLLSFLRNLWFILNYFSPLLLKQILVFFSPYFPTNFRKWIVGRQNIIINTILQKRKYCHYYLCNFNTK
jgi:hypothetical protein